MSEQYKRNPNTECFVCKKKIYKRPVEIGRGKVFCSQACYGLSNRKETPCTVCGKPILASLHKKTCSRSCANIHRVGIRYKIGRPKDKVKNQHALKLRLLESRGGKCEKCDYTRTEILEVHHKDRNRDHNELSNLEFICPNCHAEEHYAVKERNWTKHALRLEK